MQIYSEFFYDLLLIFFEILLFYFFKLHITLTICQLVVDLRILHGLPTKFKTWEISVGNHYKCNKKLETSAEISLLFKEFLLSLTDIFLLRQTYFSSSWSFIHCRNLSRTSYLYPKRHFKSSRKTIKSWLPK